MSAPRNQVLHGDCTRLLAGLPASSVDFVLTDPPYLVRYRDRAGRTVANDNHSGWLIPAFREIVRVMKPDTLCVSFYGWHAISTFMDAWQDAGLRPVGHLVFAKNYASSTRFLQHTHEQAYLLALGSPALPSHTVSDVQPFAYSGNRHHPTEKPTPAMQRIVEAFTQPGALILDPFAGSGSTLVAAKRCGRDYLGIELDAGHVETARRRLLTTNRGP
jgi:DNA modification methylase